jgi:hypothetical protein
MATGIDLAEAAHTLMKTKSRLFSRKGESNPTRETFASLKPNVMLMKRPFSRLFAALALAASALPASASDEEKSAAMRLGRM